MLNLPLACSVKEDGAIKTYLEIGIGPRKGLGLGFTWG